MFNSQTGCVSNFVEQDGCARTVIVLLLLTTVGCISYTWGYYEGIANANMEHKLHELQALKMALGGNDTQVKKHIGGHGMHLAETQAVEKHPARKLQGHLPVDTSDSAAEAAAALEDATSGPRMAEAMEQSASAQLRGLASGQQRKLLRTGHAGRVEEEET